MKELSRTDNVFIKAITYYFILFMTFTLVKRLLGNDFRATVIAAVIAFPLLLKWIIKAFVELMKIKAVQVLLMSILVLFFYLVSLLRGVSINMVAEYYFYAILGIIWGWSLYLIKDLNGLYDAFVRISKWIMLLSIFIIFVDRSIVVYSMRYSYLLSMALYFHTNEFIRGKIRYFPFLFLELLLILLFGSRGPVLCYAIYLCLRILVKSKKVVLKAALIISAGIIIKFYDLIGRHVIKILINYGVQSRTLLLLFTQLFYTSRRDIVADSCKELIWQKPIWGWGLAGEFIRMKDYPHNIVLELQIDFGIVFGILIFSVLIIAVGWLTLKLDGIESDLFLIFVSYGFAVLFFSGTYLTWDGFPMMLGLMFNLYCKRRLANHYTM